MIYNAKKEVRCGKPEADFFVLTDDGQLLRLLEAVQGGAYYQALGSSDKHFISTEELRCGIGGNWEILTNVVEAEAVAVVTLLQPG